MQTPVIVSQTSFSGEPFNHDIITDRIEVPGGFLYRTYAPRIAAIGIATTFVPTPPRQDEDLGI
ncbi:hypothetical protein [Asticcacaulis sp.]|uniref:hypothetical protein n=1 Tax=Asticcacaulis sp. TaxID=1872648 RepID=UPI0026087E36|nr:hypothetical protein [Asticcacaulis sp.]